MNANTLITPQTAAAAGGLISGALFVWLILRRIPRKPGNLGAALRDHQLKDLMPFGPDDRIPDGMDLQTHVENLLRPILADMRFHSATKSGRWWKRSVITHLTAPSMKRGFDNETCITILGRDQPRTLIFPFFLRRL